MLPAWKIGISLDRPACLDKEILVNEALRIKIDFRSVCATGVPLSVHKFYFFHCEGLYVFDKEVLEFLVQNVPSR